jgi:P27 family predicted phage terminase small subunit
VGLLKTGRPPKPTAIKILEGNPGGRPLNHNEPKPRVIAPPCPAWLTGIARAEYKRHAKLLASLRVVTEADRLALAAFAHEFGKWREAEERVDRDGPVIYSEKGGAYLNPWKNIASNHFKNMVKLMSEFGLTPASRSRIETQPEDERETSLAEKLFASVTE